MSRELCIKDAAHVGGGRIRLYDPARPCTNFLPFAYYFCSNFLLGHRQRVVKQCDFFFNLVKDTN